MSQNHIRLYEPGDEHGIVALFNAVFPEPRSESAWRWKSLNNPAGCALIGVSTHHDSISGHLCFNRVPFKTGSVVCHGAQAVDMVTSDRYRNTLARGRVMLRISRLLVHELRSQRYASFVYGLAMPNLVSFSQEVTGGGDVVCRVPQLVKPLNPIYLLRTILGSYPSVLNPLRHVGRRCHVLRNRPLEKNAALCLKHVTSFDGRFDALWDAVGSRFAISTVRDSRYLGWRYPPSLYTVLCHDDGSSVHGFVALRITIWNGWRVGCIADLLADSSQSSRHLVQGAISYFRNKQVDIIRCWMMEHISYYDTLRRFGFASRRSPYSLVVRSHSPTLDQQFLRDASNWHITWGDSDGV
jgi:hypothetical protein